MTAAPRCSSAPTCMPEVERVCDRVGIIRDGGLVTVADIGDLKAKALRRIEFHFDGAVPADRRSARCRASST